MCKNNRLIKSLYILVLTIVLVCGCNGGEMAKEQPIKDSLQTIEELPMSKWNSLAQKKIFFAHQSVGNNIIMGINEIKSRNPQIHINVVDTKLVHDFDQPIFGHYSNIGRNDYPLSKIDDFIKIINNGLGNKIDIALLKFCFVDIGSDSDIHAIFNKYTEAITKLQTKYPNMTIVHVTVPLLKKDSEGLAKRLKNFANVFMNKIIDNFFSDSHNVRRNEYNKLIIERYNGKEPIFDLARLESIKPNGKRETFWYDGKEYYALAFEYTDDGGHLNEKGRQYIAEQFLIFLANL